MFRKLTSVASAIALAAVLYSPKPAQSLAFYDWWGDAIISAVNGAGFLAVGYGISQIGSDGVDATENFQDTHTEKVGEVIALIEEQTRFETMDHDDYEQLDNAEFFAETTADAAQLAYLQNWAGSLGVAGSDVNGEVASLPPYGSDDYNFFKDVLTSHYKIRNSELADDIAGNEFNNIDSCENLPDNVPNIEDLCVQFQSLLDAEQEQQDVAGLDSEEQMALKKLSNQLGALVGAMENNSADMVAVQKVSLDEVRTAMDALLAAQEVSIRSEYEREPQFINASYGVTESADLSQSPLAVSRDTSTFADELAVQVASVAPDGAAVGDAQCDIRTQEDIDRIETELSTEYGTPQSCLDDASGENCTERGLITADEGTFSSLNNLWNTCGFGQDSPDDTERKVSIADCMPSGLGGVDEAGAPAALRGDAERLFGQISSAQIMANFGALTGTIEGQEDVIAQNAVGSFLKAGEVDLPEELTFTEQKQEDTNNDLRGQNAMTQKVKTEGVYAAYNITPFPDLADAKARAQASEMVEAYLADDCTATGGSQQTSVEEDIKKQRRELAKQSAFEAKVYARTMQDGNTLGHMTESMASMVNARTQASKTLREDIKVLTEAITNLYYLMEVNTQASLHNAVLQARLYDLEDSEKEGNDFRMTNLPQINDVAALRNDQRFVQLQDGSFVPVQAMNSCNRLLDEQSPAVEARSGDQTPVIQKTSALLQ